MDLMGTLLYGIFALVLLPICFVIGRAMDTDWYCVQLRRLTKKNYIVLNIVEGDGKTYITKVVNADNDVVNVDPYQWTITKGRIYRKDKQQIGMQINKRDVRWGNQGAPNVFVSKDDIKPIALGDVTTSQVKPNEIGSINNSYIRNEIEKQLYKKNDNNLLIYCILGVCVLCLIGTIIAAGAASDARDILTGKTKVPTTTDTTTTTTTTTGSTQPVIIRQPSGG